jgi:prephenate dehydrogenase
VRWKKVALVGVGLLGGSLGLALKQRRLAGSVVGFVRRAASVKECEKAGAVDKATLDLGDAVVGADLIVVCTPLAQMTSLLKEMLPALKPGALITDVGSVKGPVVADFERVLAKSTIQFIGSHPMAGGEKMGVGAARADLFVNAVCVVTPTQRSKPSAAQAVEELWKSVGGRVLKLDPKAHDDLVSRSSHLPHFVAAAIASAVLDPGRPVAQGLVCANGFRDVTRIASGSPEMWRDIGLANANHLGKALRSFIRELQKLQQMIEKKDGAKLEKFLNNAKEQRDKWHSAGAAQATE